MTTETKLKSGLVISLLVLLWSTVMWNNDIITINSQKQTIDSLTHENDSISIQLDSLREEHFIISVQNGRYEVTFDHLNEINPKLGKEMEDWMSHNTE